MLYDLKIIQTILSFKDLGSNWAGYNSVRPSDETIMDAINLYHWLSYQEIDNLRACCSGDGEISFFLDSHEVFADIGVRSWHGA